MGKICGDLERFNWEVRTPPVSPRVIGEFLLPKAVELMKDISVLADNVIDHHGRWPIESAFKFKFNDAAGTLITGWRLDVEITDGMIRNTMAGVHMPKIKYPGSLADKLNQFSECVDKELGDVEPSSEDKGLIRAWRLLRTLQRPIGQQAWYEKNTSGHCDDMKSGTHVSSVQLSEHPSEWVLDYVDKETGQIGQQRVFQGQGEEVLMRSSPVQLAVRESGRDHAESNTPRHLILQKDPINYRYSIVRYLAEEREPVINKVAKSGKSKSGKFTRFISGIRSKA